MRTRNIVLLRPFCPGVYETWSLFGSVLTGRMCPIYGRVGLVFWYFFKWYSRLVYFDEIFPICMSLNVMLNIILNWFI